MLAINTILLPTDFSERSQYAFSVACAMARDYKARLILLHVAEIPTLDYGEGLMPVKPADLLATAQEKLSQLPVPAANMSVERRVVQGDPATQIIQVAHDLNVDLIVMGTHGRSGLGRLLMGSVAEQVLRKSSCPVLTVKMPPAETATVREMQPEPASV